MPKPPTLPVKGRNMNKSFRIYPQGTPKEYFTVLIYSDYSQFYILAEKAYGVKFEKNDKPLGTFTWHPNNQYGYMGTLRFPKTSLSIPGVIAHEINHAAIHFYAMREDKPIIIKRKEKIIIQIDQEEIKCTIVEFLTDSFYEKLRRNP